MADNARTLILVSDRQIGFDMISTDPETQKVRQVHPRWWLMYSGNDISPVFPIADRIESKLLELSGGQAAVDGGGPEIPQVLDVENAVSSAIQIQLRQEIEAAYLASRGWTMDSFHQAIPNLPPKLVTTIFGEISRERFDISLIVAGFDRLGYGHIITVDGRSMATKRHANPGYAAIGSGDYAAMYWMAYRDIGYASPSREVLYATIEGKLFAELSTGVGAYTDTFVVRSDKPTIRLSDERIDEAIVRPICEKLAPANLTDKYRKMLNEIVDLQDLPMLEMEGKLKPKKSLSGGTVAKDVGQTSQVM
ncbi:MAG TPA: hypothetical protein VMA98_01825 [Candidatus Acidoferrales bacterium]|nr:hypothetical protein [Candidatus Acidoferrales bacterium]